MKRVRFESPLKDINTNIMNHDSECHSPRQMIAKQINTVPVIDRQEYHRVLPYSNDPVSRYEFGNSSPHPTLNKSYSPKFLPENLKSPSNDLDLSMLDFNNIKPLKHTVQNYSPFAKHINDKYTTVLATIEPKQSTNGPTKRNDFFLKKDNFINIGDHTHSNRLTLDKENNPLIRKNELAKLGSMKCSNDSHNDYNQVSLPSTDADSDEYCNCHHCIKTSTIYNGQQCLPQYKHNGRVSQQQCCCVMQKTRPCSHKFIPVDIPTQCSCKTQNQIHKPINAIDKKTWAIEKYEQQKSDCNEIVEKNTIIKQKREPTVADLFKIIKLQNEQLQLLQEKVDKFIESNNKKESDNMLPLENCVTEHVAVQADTNQHKISIGVMTSFEMVCTSTVINKEFIKQNEAQIQCNRSQISIKEVSKTQPVNINFLEGIRKNVDTNQEIIEDDMTRHTNADDKTLNEYSLYNVHVDNVATPLMSPEQTLYLDVKDYSDSDSDPDDPSNVGWTYYNKVMTHVNGILQESDMPSSASALYRNSKQKCLMQIDKTNVSVTKRVTFGQNPVEIPQAPINMPTTDTSLKMNQLAAKYLKNSQEELALSNRPAQTTDLSFATKNYMERHKIIQGKTASPPQQRRHEIPRFLDITVLKQQPKFL